AAHCFQALIVIDLQYQSGNSANQALTRIILTVRDVAGGQNYTPALDFDLPALVTVVTGDATRHPEKMLGTAKRAMPTFDDHVAIREPDAVYKQGVFISVQLK